MAIDLATGLLTLESKDIGLFGNIPVELNRYYSVNDRHQRGILGPGWRWNWDFRLKQTLEGFTLTTDRGEDVQFAEPLGEVRTRLFDTGRQLELRKLSDSEVVLIGYGLDRSPNELLFTRVGTRAFRFSGVRNPNRFRVDLVYDGFGRLASIHQQREARAIRFSYDARGRLAGATVTLGTRALGVQVQYTYDDRGRLVSVSDQDGITNQYVYDDGHRIGSEARRSGAIYQFAYDSDSRCVHARGANGANERHLTYDPVARITVERDSHGEPCTYEYNERGQIIRETSSLGVEIATQYDAEGRVVGAVEPDKFTRRYEYDALGRQVATHYPGDRTARIEYDDEHYPVARIDSRGLRSTFERNDRGQVTAIELPDGGRVEYEYDENGDLTVYRAVSGGEVRFAYDTQGRVVARQNAVGRSSQYVYDDFGLLVQERDAAGSVTEFGYDSQQRPAWRRTPDGVTVRWAWEPNAVYEHRSDGATRYVRSNSCGQPLEICDFAGNVSRFEWDTEQLRMLAFHAPEGGRHEFAYDADGNLIEHTSPAGRVRRYEWKDSRLVATVDAAERRIEREYDALGFLIKLKSDDGEISYEFDPKHCALSKLTSPDAVLEHERDDFGIVRTTRSDDIEVHQRFEQRDLLAEISTSLGDKVSFAYDPRGQISVADFGFGQQSFGYDPVGRELRRELVGVGSVTRRYDAVGELLELVFQPAPKRAVAAGAEWMSTPGVGYTRSYDWAPPNRLARQVDSLRGWRRFVHGPTRRLLAVDESSGQTHFYGYDKDGNRVFRAEVADNHQLINLPFQGTQPLRWQDLPGEALRRGGRDVFYHYDADGRLLDAQGIDRSLYFEYDPAGYVTAKHVVFPDGRRDSWRFNWNAFGQLTGVTTPTGDNWAYRYDGMGRRVGKVDPKGEVTRYVWHEGKIMYELKGSDASFFVHHPQTHELIAVRGKVTGHVVGDHLGAPAEVIGLDGQVTVLTRESWGRRTDQVPIPQGFPGQYHDEETGLYYNYLRYYDPEIGRYLSPDPLGLRGGLNVYGYVATPEQFIDPYGEIARRPGDNIVVPADQVDTGNRTQVNRPPQGDPYMGGHDVVNGQRTDLGGATVTDVRDGNRGIVAHAYNGGPEGDLGPSRTSNVGAGASTSSWWHSEQNAMTAVLRGDIPLSGKGPITFHISREPCCRCRAALFGPDGLAQRVANQTGRSVIITYPTDTEDVHREKPIKPNATNCG